MFRRTLLISSLVVSALAIADGACEEYQPPPKPVLLGLESGVLSDPRAPLLIDFGTAIDPETLVAKIAILDTDVEGNLKDEDPDPESTLQVLVQRDPGEGDVGAKAEIENGGTRLKLNLDSALPVGPKLVLLIEPGLKSTDNSKTSNSRIRIPFSYVVKCAAGASKFASGNYFVLLDVEKPLGTQIQLLAFIDVDPNTGALVSQFTNADRDPKLQCPTPCPSTDVCRTLPAPECVAPSTRAGTVAEQSDFIPNPTPPTGYSFVVQGCAVDDGPSSGVLTAPATMVVESPKVTVEGLTMTASFAAGPDGIVRASGSLTADLVRLGTNPLGPGKGTMTAIRIADDKVPANIPHPPAGGSSSSRDGGASDASR
jgi:hypothetical protein